MCFLQGTETWFLLPKNVSKEKEKTFFFFSNKKNHDFYNAFWMRATSIEVAFSVVIEPNAFWQGTPIHKLLGGRDANEPFDIDYFTI